MDIRLPRFWWALMLVLSVSTETVSQGIGSSSAAGDRAFTIDDLLALRNVGELALSPSGRRLAYSSRGELYVVGVQPNASPLGIGRGARAEWSRNGKRLAFVRVVEGHSQVYTWSIATRISSKLLDLGTDARIIAGPRWSPDGRGLLLSVVAPGIPADAGHEGTAPRRLDADTAAEAVFAHLLPEDPSGIRLPPEAGSVEWIDSDSGQRTRAVQVGPPCTSLSWSPDSRQAVCSARIQRSSRGYTPPKSRVSLVDLSRGLVTGSFDIDAAPWSDGQAQWSPDGKRLAYVGTPRPYQHESVFVCLPDGTARRNITAAVDREVMAFKWDSASGRLLASIADGVAMPVISFDVASGAANPLRSAGDHVGLFDLDSSGDLAWVQSTGDSYGVIRFLRRKTREAATLVNLNPHIQEWRLGQQRIVHWQSKAAEALEGILITPYGYREGTHYPLVVDPYTHRVDDFQGVSVLANQLLAEGGYAVFYPNPRSFHGWANTSKSTEYGLPAQGADADNVLVDDVLSGVDALIAAGIADADRLALYSFSDGATSANFLITRTDRFKAAVSGGGVTDFFSYYFMVPANDWTSPDSLSSRTPADSASVYTTFSPLFHLQSVHTPLLLLTGDEDRRALQEIMFYNGLRRLDRPVALIRYPGEGHEIRSPQNQRDYWLRAKSFLDQHLTPDPQ